MHLLLGQLPCKSLKSNKLVELNLACPDIVPSKVIAILGERLACKALHCWGIALFCKT